MKILFVDAGNYCRSPAAEAVARTRSAGRVGLVFESAGLKDKHVGDTADPRTIEACAARGYQLGGFRCREIAPAQFDEFDLILAMDRDNLQQLRERQPAGSRARLELFLGDAEVPDPYYGEADGFGEMMRQIEQGVDALLARVDAGD